MSKRVTSPVFNKKVEPIIPEYTDQILTEYKGNPLIEALPPILSEDAATDFMSKRVPFNKLEREQPAELRFQMVPRLKDYFQLLPRHFDLERKISTAIRQGYINRNPLNPVDAERMQKWYEDIKAGIITPRPEGDAPTMALGFTIVGVSGIGKSTAVSKVLSYYPQYFLHNEYHGHPLTMTQLTWLKLDCPPDGSLKSLCLNFFRAIDNILKTNYYKENHPSKRLSAASMLPVMSTVAYTHRLGVLIIDEIQNLDVSHSGGAEQMLNWCVSLVNDVGVPVILIGTPKAEPILQGDFRNARRGSGQGDLSWDRITDRADWNLLIEGMWGYQWTATPVPFINEFADVLYDESQGIVDIGIKLFILAQYDAITSGGSELITVERIKKVANKYLRLVRPMIDALKSGDPSKITLYPDILPRDWEKVFADQVKGMRNRLKKQQEDPIKNIIESEMRELKNRVIYYLLQKDISPESAHGAAEQVIRTAGATVDFEKATALAYKLALEFDIAKDDTTKTKGKTVKPKVSYVEPDLRYYHEKAKTNKRSAYTEMVEACFIRHPYKELELG